MAFDADKHVPSYTQINEGYDFKFMNCSIQFKSIPIGLIFRTLQLPRISDNSRCPCAAQTSRPNPTTAYRDNLVAKVIWAILELRNDNFYINRQINDPAILYHVYSSFSIFGFLVITAHTYRI